MAVRKIVKIDESKCNGCGQCVPGCAEGALAVIDGKARLLKETYCDGLGACLGECPQGAITIEDREAAQFDAAAAEAHVAALAAGQGAARAAGRTERGMGVPPMSSAPSERTKSQGQDASGTHGQDARATVGGGCPGSRMMQFARRGAATGGSAQDSGAAPAGQRPAVESALGQWPVQLALVPIEAPYYEDTELVLTADCAAYALGDFHERFLRGRSVAIACPKLDDVSPYVEKLAEILRRNTIRGLVVVHMEVPCCGGIVRLAEEAARRSGRSLPVRDVMIGLQGETLSDRLMVMGGV